MVSFSLSSHKWSLIGLFKFIIIIHLKSFIKVVYQETCYLGTTVVAGGDLEGGKRSGFWTQGPSLLKLWIHKKTYKHYSEMEWRSQKREAFSKETTDVVYRKV